MRTISIDLKARIFALVVGYTLIGAFLLALGVSEKAAASDLSLHAQLEHLIDAIVDEDLKDIDARLTRRFTRDTSSDESTVSVPNRKLLLADSRLVVRIHEADPERVDP